MGSGGSLETRDWWGRAEGHVGRQIWKGVMPASMLYALLISISRTAGMGGTPSLPLPPLTLGSSLRPEQPGVADKGLQPPPQADGAGGRTAAQCQLLTEGPYTCLKHWGSTSLKNIEIFFR